MGFEKDIIYADDPGGRIAYVSNSSSAGGGLEGIDDDKTSYDIWVMDLGSFDLGGRSSQSKFYKVVFPGSDQSDEIHPALSPKGDWVAFSSNRDDDWNIYVFHLESEQLYQNYWPRQKLLQFQRPPPQQLRQDHTSQNTPSFIP